MSPSNAARNAKCAAFQGPHVYMEQPIVANTVSDLKISGLIFVLTRKEAILRCPNQHICRSSLVSRRHTTIQAILYVLYESRRVTMTLDQVYDMLIRTAKKM